MAEEGSSTERGGDLGFTAAAFVVALLPRLYIAIAWAREPVWDGHYYDFGARRIAAGLGYSDDVVIAGQPVWHPWCHYPVGYSGFLAVVYRLFGQGPHVATVANAVVGALLVAVVHRLARYATTEGRARVAALLAALLPGLVVYAALLMTEPLAGLGMLTAAWLFARDRELHPLRGASIAGIVLGLTTLVRPQSLVCAPALGLISLCAASRMPLRNRLRSAAAAGGIALAAATLVVAPWTARNCRVMDGCALVSTNAGWNLAIGSFPRATGRFETLRATDGCPIVTGQVQQDRCWLDEGIGWIRRDPWRWLSLVPKKLGYTFDHESFPIGYLGEADPAAWPEPRRATGRALLTLTHELLLLAAALAFVQWPAARRKDKVEALVAASAILLLGAYALFGDDHAIWPVAVMIPVLASIQIPRAERDESVVAYLAFLVATVCVTHAIFFGEDRYHVVVTPALCVLAACALGRARRPAETRAPDRHTPAEDGGPSETGDGSNASSERER